MRNTHVPVIVLAALVLLAPTGATLTTPLPASLHGEEVFDPDDATLLRILHPHLTLRTDAQLQQLILDPPSLSTLLERIAAHAGTTITENDIEPFSGLDARVETPVRTMLAAIEAAWTLRNQAFTLVPLDAQLEYLTLQQQGKLGTPRARELAASIDETSLIEAAILLLDTAENIVTAQLQQAVRDGAWPATPTADPVGILRLGGTGNDDERVFRVLQIDPSGDDYYRNNAGGTNLGQAFENPTGIRYQVALSIDFDGNDHYEMITNVEQQGGASFGLGILLDYTGNDYYRCVEVCQGAAAPGIGIFRDYAGNDVHRALGDFNTGYGASQGLGLLRDETGDDTYTCGGRCGGQAFNNAAIGLLWDRAGSDVYDAMNGVAAFGYGEGGGHGWLVDEGPETDYYDTAYVPGPNAHGCNDCTWSSGGTGRGNDNHGGLAWLLTRQNAFEG